MCEEVPEGFVEAEGDGNDFYTDPEYIISSAMEVYSWFVMWPLDVDETIPSADGSLFRLLDERFCRKTDMDALLQEYFSPEICAQLWAWDFYTEQDGYLYASLDGDFRWIDDRIENVSYVQTEDTASRRVYEVTVTYADDGDETTPNIEILRYVQENQNGFWQFTTFPFFW